MANMNMDIYEMAYNKYAEKDWDYVDPSHEKYDMIMKNRNAYIFDEAVKNGDIQIIGVDFEKLDATTKRNNNNIKFR